MPAATVDHSQRICEVWACNLDEEMKKIRQVIRKYNYVAMDTEFPGVVARPIGEFRSNADYQYQLQKKRRKLLRSLVTAVSVLVFNLPSTSSVCQFLIGMCVGRSD
uniref:poly(A)-specific ribonuclease n=1 Tax=Myotis myotis TaxID=51298 RepID=A0A7J7Z1J3_MYOMY|nr:CCR4-NOT transcription complex subunit 7 [Myotis myotis]